MLKRFVAWPLAVLAAVAVGIVALVAAVASPTLAQAPPQFGSPPSGEVPILFNDQHVYFEDSGGDGAAVIFSHGFLMDHDMFAPQVDALAG